MSSPLPVLHAADGSDAVALWERPPLGPGAGPLAAVRHAVSREATLLGLRARRNHGRSVARVHRSLPAGPGGPLRDALLGGAVAELVAPGTRPARLIDAVASASGVPGGVGTVRPVAGGAVVARVRWRDGRGAVLRAWPAGERMTPPPRELLGRLARLGLPVPVVLASGTTGEAGWSVEPALPGRRPRRLTARLLADAVDAVARFPPSGTADAVVADLANIAAALPSRASAIEDLRTRAGDAAREQPGVVRHGDLWSGNLLEQRGRLSGIVDWDAATDGGTPGADLLQLVVTSDRHRRRLMLGAAWCERPWLSVRWREASSRYWSAVGIAPTVELLELAAVSWWAAEIAGTLRRIPERAEDDGWLATNVDRVLGAALRPHTSRW